MAKLDGKFLRGAIWDLIFKKVGDMQLLTSKVEPGTMKHTVGTKMASSTFGLASKMSSNIRQAIRDELRVANDGTIHFRLTSALHVLLTQCRDNATKTYSFNEDSFKCLAGLDFNSSVPLMNKLPGKLNVVLEDGLLQVAYADAEQLRSLRFIEGSTSCKLTFGVMLFRLNTSLVSRDYDLQSVMVQRNAAGLDNIAFSFRVPNDCLYLLTVTLNYYNGSIPLQDKKMNSGAIYDAAIVQGVYDDSPDFRWLENDLVFR